MYNTISYNSAQNTGGGIFCSGSPSPSNRSVISNNTISNNTCSGNGGGGISISGGLDIYNNIISYNVCTTIGSYSGGGGILWMPGADNASLKNNVLSNNSVYSATVSSGGGGIRFYTSTNSTFNMSGNVIANNSDFSTGADSGGGGVFIDGSGIISANDAILTNNTIVNNSSAKGGGIYCARNGNAIISNCIVWGNIADSAGTQLFLSTDLSDPAFQYCNIQSGSSAFALNNNFYTGAYQNNIDMNPMFISPSTGSGNGFDGLTSDWSLQTTSPCINSGDPAGMYDSTDIAGNIRVSGSFIDMGAYELFLISTGGMNEMNLNKISVFYPNPSSGKLMIYTADERFLSLTKVEIYNPYGKIVYFKAFPQKNTYNEIELMNPQKGVYYAKYTVEMSNSNAKKTFTEKIVIQ